MTTPGRPSTLRILRRVLLGLASAIGAFAVLSARPQTAVKPAAPNPVTVRKMHDAIAAAQAGGDQRALTIVESLLAEQPHFAPAVKLQGMLLEDMGRDSEAARAYANALALAPADPELLLKVGTIELLTGHADRAIPLLEHRLRLLPGDEEGSYYLAQAWHLRADNDRALAVLRDAMKKSPGHPPLWQKYGELLLSAGDNAQALPWLLKAQQAEPTRPRIDFDLAVASYNAMDLKNAESYAARQARSQPADIDNLMLLASVQIKLADWRSANANLQHVTEARPDDAAALVALGHCRLELGQYAGALDALHAALQADPTQILAHFYLSRAYTALGDSSESQHQAALYRELQQHLSFSLPKDEAAREDAVLARVRTLLAAGKESEAVSLLAQNDRGPDVTAGSAWVSLGATWLSMGNLEAAERSFRHALQLDPHTPDAQTYLGYLALQQNDLSAADAFFEAELKRDANHSFATAELGEVRYRQGRWAEAATLLAKSKTTSPTLLYLLCDSYFHLGKPQQAALIAEAIPTYARTQPEILAPLDRLLRRNDQSALADRLASTAPGPRTP